MKKVDKDCWEKERKELGDLLSVHLKPIKVFCLLKFEDLLLDFVVSSR